VLMLLLFGPPVAAFAVVTRKQLTGADVVRPFAVSGVLAFLLTGILLTATLAVGGEAAIIYLEMGVAAFGGTIMSGTSALVLWFREQRRAREARGQRPWPHGEDD
jgi:Na+-driven multidrug efflux pump